MSGLVSSATCSGWVDGLGECQGNLKCCLDRIPTTLVTDHQAQYSLGCFRGCRVDDIDCIRGGTSGLSLRTMRSDGKVGKVADTISRHPTSIFNGEGWKKANYPKISSSFDCLDKGKDLIEDHSSGRAKGKQTATRPFEDVRQYLLLLLIATLSFVFFLFLGVLAQLAVYSVTALRHRLNGSGFRSDGEHGFLTGPGAEDGSEFGIDLTVRSDSSGRAIDDVVVGFEDNSNAGLFTCIESAESFASAALPCIERPRKSMGGEDIDDTPWAI